ncbi:hypothetical protein CAI21_13930 [Alkalilimnicola ehrlichii]|uniref:glycosyltransferase family 2 protein n=1 Tax=Alkalilimnicola ehrlichii TaxID=351052 RepID=UPI000E2E6839|nr:glycosyltransferase family A protein [Alkalilimnicola ehrlichii]RFA28010.1 hypothetical protein CAI21_13930 [Alkalilimnicola ehrlichii]
MSLYPDVAASGLDPAQHYLQYGGFLGRAPGPDFDSAWYAATYPDVRAAGLNPLVHFLRHGRSEGRLPRANPAADLEDKLWMGFSQSAVGELARISADESAPRDWRSYAYWALARWYASRQEWRRSAAALRARRALRPAFPGHLGPILLESDCLRRLGQAAAAQALLKRALHTRARSPDLLLALANTCDGSEEAERLRLDWINRVYRTAGLAPLRKRQPNKPLAIDNVWASRRWRLAGFFGPKVSVIVPAYNAAATLATALSSVLEQSWRNLEVLVVNDASKDGTAELIADFARRDRRVVALRHDENRGAYAARNTGLQQATGKYITTHDSDDWSHPQKLELQVQALEARSDIVGVLTSWARVEPSLHFGRWRAESGLVHRNLSSFMFRRDAIERVGAWDGVRAGADAEFYRRLERVFGATALSDIQPTIPLAFGRLSEGSLTHRQDTHLRTQFFGTRREYDEAAAWWHSHSRPAELYIPPQASERRFPAPDRLLDQRPVWRQVDTTVVADFGEGSGELYDFVESLVERQQTVALLHWPDFDRTPLTFVADAYRGLAAKSSLAILAPDDELETNVLLIKEAHLLRYRLDRVPSIRYQRLLVDVVGKPATAVASSLIRGNLFACFGSQGEWCESFADERLLSEVSV